MFVSDLLFQMGTRRGWPKRGGLRAQHAPYPEFHEPPKSERATPTGEIVEIGTGRVRPFVPPRLLPRPLWADSVESEGEKEDLVERES